ncbi:hypothetical protein A8B79_04410 [Balneola sp. EhC07]|nr:hypothetical protein A8B79_04410 [Balneola sp. EhC07]
MTSGFLYYCDLFKKSFPLSKGKTDGVKKRLTDLIRNTHRAGPEGPAGLKSHNKIYASRAFTPGG